MRAYSRGSAGNPPVNVAAPQVNVEAPVVNVPAPQVTVNPATVNIPTDMTSQEKIAYAATSAGGRVAFNISTGVVALSALSGELALAALVNPTGSGKDIFIDMGEFGSTVNCLFKRYRGGTLSALSSPISGFNMSGGSATSVAQFYVAPNFTRTGGTVAKIAHVGAYNTYFAWLRGRTVLRPGNSLAWTITPPVISAFSASIYFEYWETTAAA